MLAKIVKVKFFHPQTGPIDETYDMTNPNDMACWKANEKLSAYIQVGVNVVEEMADSDENETVLREAKAAAEKIFNSMRKGDE